MVYYTRMNRSIYEDRGDYAAAKSNLNSLLSICSYLTANGVDREDMSKACRTRLELIDPQWGVYALSNTQNNTYGSSVAAGSGTYYGAIAGSQSFSERSITSFYVELELNSSKDFAGLISAKIDGTRVILINLNFQKEGDTARAIPNGTYDANIRETFRHLNTLDCPVAVRIGGEMDVWTKTVTPSDYIKAYRYVANIARTEAPKVELIRPGETSAGTWAPITRINESAGEELLIGAAGMTYKNSDMKAVYKLDNGSAASTSGSPNHYHVDLSGMEKGSNHRLDVPLSDGNGYSVSRTYTVAYLDNGNVRCFEGWRPTVFSDVKDGAYYLNPVKWAVKNGVTNGTSDTTFSPGQGCTRGQIVTFLFRALA